ncbi:xyloside xylosyltransferase 1-like isoform X2 [Artemia franciscana]|uniref:Uncharacterized protein n=1 Tax=Artemia franciscana TaxID=6661 RepID=A0AA88HUB5_ARTSF|nr:hypothetical protein QYM36_012343 [Artemia franciscana]
MPRFTFRQFVVITVLTFGLFHQLTLFICDKDTTKGPSNTTIEVVITCATNKRILNITKKSDSKTLEKLRTLLGSINKTSEESYIRFNLISYEEEIPRIESVLQSTIGLNKKITYRFESLNRIAESYRSEINLSKNYTWSGDQRFKASDVTFHLRPLFPKIFSYEKVIALDVDLDFRCSIKLLHKQFENLYENNIAALAYNQSPYYRRAFRSYRIKNPGTHIGDFFPGYQGLNTGVMLMNLEKMRSSKVYNSYFTHASLKTLFRKYNMTSLLGDQDFFTVLGAEHPDLFYILDCTFNRQMDSFEFSHSLFDKYHKCDEDINIYHGNGDSIIPSSNVDP